MSTVPTRGDLYCKFPLELVQHILEYCDYTTLPSASLVCRSWVPSCRSKTFTRFTVGDNTLHDLDNAASILVSKYSTAPKFIQEMKFILKESELEGTQRSPEQGILNDSLESILTHLKDRASSVKKLYLAYDGCSLLSPKAPVPQLGRLAQHFISSFRDTTELELRLFDEHDASILIQFTSSFPRLEVLKMHSGCLHSTGSAELVKVEVSGYHLPLSLKTLVLTGADSSHAVESDGMPLYYHWLSTRTFPNLLNLSFHKVDIEGEWDTDLHPEIDPYLRSATKLRVLHVGFDSGHLTPNPTVFYNLSVPQNLECLIVSIRNLIEGSFGFERRLLELIQKMISTITSSRFRQIVFNVSGSGFRVLAEHWDALDCLLAATRFAAVHVKLVIPFSDITLEDETSDEDLPRARQVFPRCEEQGRLSAIRAPFTVKTRDWDAWDDPKIFQDYEEVDWVCSQFWT